MIETTSGPYRYTSVVVLREAATLMRDAERVEGDALGTLLFNVATWLDREADGYEAAVSGRDETVWLLDLSIAPALTVARDYIQDSRR